ncbi:MAG: phosphoribosylaminoimidazolesuccinocarboxamide synthase [Oscillospiraceae bacterium]|nr:phosphoribosylaminoimidazolesuccinocarboxamide synthase [Oscillospiraceae bacterium]
MKISYEGKVRQIFDAGEEHLVIVTTDRVSAFDVILPTPIPEKGRILNGISEFWFECTKNIIANHVVSVNVADYPEPYNARTEWQGRSMLVKKLKMLPFECIVRGYLTGNSLKSYRKDGTICGMKLRDGYRESEKFDAPLFCPSTKAELGAHDEYVTFEQVADTIGATLAAKVRDVSLAVYSACAEYARGKGIIIADTKFEFGLDAEGNLVLGDEVLAPDSSRFWDASAYEVGAAQNSYDKQGLRDWLTANGFAGVEPPPELPPEVVAETRAKYITAYELITGRTL